MDDAENTFAGNPFIFLVLDTSIVKNGSFVHPDATTVNRFCERDLVGMEIVEA